MPHSRPAILLKQTARSAVRHQGRRRGCQTGRVRVEEFEAHLATNLLASSRLYWVVDLVKDPVQHWDLSLHKIHYTQPRHLVWKTL